MWIHFIYSSDLLLSNSEEATAVFTLSRMHPRKLVAFDTSIQRTQPGPELLESNLALHL